MLFFSKRSNTAPRSSNTEACVSILGLFVAVGFLGGLGSLIYGLIKGSSSGKIGGGVVLGVSVLGGIVLALVFVFCLKVNDDDSNEDQQQASSHHPQRRQQRRQPRHEPTTSREITHISTVHKTDAYRSPAQSNGHGVQMYPHHNGLSDSNHSSYGKQVPLSPSKVPSSIHFNQNTSSVNNPQHQLVITSNINHHTYNRH